MRAKIFMIAVNMTTYASVRKPALDAPEPVELEFARDRWKIIDISVFTFVKAASCRIEDIRE
jgi:hypothetical protein